MNILSPLTSNPEPLLSTPHRHIRKAAEEFEAFFIRSLLSQMRKATHALSTEQGALSHATNHSMIELADITLADELARRHTFGIANRVLAQWLPTAGKDGNISVKTMDASAASSYQKEAMMGSRLMAFSAPVYRPNDKV